MKLNTYLLFNGTCEAAFNAYAKIFGGRIVMMMTYADAPTGEPVPTDNGNLVMHARLDVGGCVLMGSDSPAPHFKPAQGFSASAVVDTPAEADRIYAALADGGEVVMPIAETFWAQRFGMVRDRFGTPWMINCEKMDEANAGKSDAAIQPFVISRTVSASRDTLWKALTEVDRLRQWWGPEGAEITSATVDLKPGGRFHYCMRLANADIWGLMSYCVIEKPERLEFINSFSDADGGITRHPMAPTWPIQMHSTFRLIEEGPSTIFQVEWRPLYPTSEERAAFEGSYASVTQGWSGTFDRLEAYLVKH